MPKVPEGKGMLQVYVDSVLKAKLWHFIREKYPKSTFGALSFEVEKALEHYLEAFDLHTNAHKYENPALPRSHKNAQKIICDLRNRGITKECTVDEVYKSISNVRGSDPRTQKTWLKFLTNHGYLKWRSNRVLEISSAFDEIDEFFSKISEDRDHKES